MPIPGDSGIIPGNKANIETPTSVFLRQHRDARPCLDLMGGTEAMRRAGEKRSEEHTSELQSRI